MKASLNSHIHLPSVLTMYEDLKYFLDQKNVSYKWSEHPTAYTALETAAAAHVFGRQFVKSVVLSDSKHYILCVLSSVRNIDFSKLENHFEKKFYLASEQEVFSLFPQWEKGAEPPFGHFAHLKTFLDKNLEENEEIVFNAGLHTEIIRMKLHDYLAISKAEVLSFSKPI